MRGVVGTVLALSMLSAAAAYGQTSPPGVPKPSSARPSESTQQPAVSTKPTPPIVEASPASKDEHKAAPVTEHETVHSTPDWWLISVTGLLVIATGVLAWYTRRLVRGAEDTARRQLRAYICLEEGRIEPHGNEGYCDVIFTLKNSGQTPAYNVETWQITRIVDLAEPPYVIRTPDKWGMVGPGAGIGCKLLHNPLTPADRSDIKLEKKTVIVWGQVTYKDAFGQERYTNFCHILGSETQHGWRLMPAKQGNDAD